MHALADRIAIVTGASSGIGVDRFGGLDIAFNNAGTLGEMAPACDISLRAWRDTLDTNLTGSVLHLACDASSFMTGAAMLVDGGISITRA